jgi:DNA polymerase V
MGIAQVYQPGFQLSKADVMLLNLMPDTVCQGELNFEPVDAKDKTRLMIAFDAINVRFGRGTIHIGSAGVNLKFFPQKGEFSL